MDRFVIRVVEDRETSDGCRAGKYIRVDRGGLQFVGFSEATVNPDLLDWIMGGYELERVSVDVVIKSISK